MLLPFILQNLTASQGITATAATGQAQTSVASGDIQVKTGSGSGGRISHADRYKKLESIDAVGETVSLQTTKGIGAVTSNAVVSTSGVQNSAARCEIVDTPLNDLMELLLMEA